MGRSFSPGDPLLLCGGRELEHPTANKECPLSKGGNPKKSLDRGAFRG